jgi:hypothetical protein
VGLVARAVEAVDIPTVVLNMIWVFQKVVGMPRIAAIEYPFGRPYGEVGDAEGQRAVLRAALRLAESASAPGQVEHLPFRWHQLPEETEWHPAEPSPIIALMTRRKPASGS